MNIKNFWVVVFLCVGFHASIFCMDPRTPARTERSVKFKTPPHVQQAGGARDVSEKRWGKLDDVLAFFEAEENRALSDYRIELVLLCYLVTNETFLRRYQQIIVNLKALESLTSQMAAAARQGVNRDWLTLIAEVTIAMRQAQVAGGARVQVGGGAGSQEAEGAGENVPLVGGDPRPDVADPHVQGEGRPHGDVQEFRCCIIL